MNPSGSDAARSPRWPGVAALDVDDLMDEIQMRAKAARRSQEQLQALLEAVTAISSDLELSDVLGRIVRSACSLVNAKYGALGVLGPDGEHLMEFVTEGVSAEERAAIGAIPRGHGILGLLIRDPHPRRLSDIRAHPDSYGFPPNHPPMRSFLGAPIRIRDEVFGNLYLTEHLGEKEFSDADESMLVALAAAAGVAIDNARMYEGVRSQREWAQPITELTRSLLERESEDAALTPMARRLVGLTGAAICLVVLRDEPGRPSVRAAGRSGESAPGEPLEGKAWPDLTSPPWTEVLEAGRELLVIPGASGEGVESVASVIAEAGGLTEPGPLAVVPITAAGTELGHLVLMWPSGLDESASHAMPGLATFSEQAGLGLVAARAKHNRALVATLEDRARIARDMHDHVIQRLFATGLSLQAAERLTDHPAVRARLNEAVDELDVAIKSIRATIFGLHTMATSTAAVDALHQLVQSFAPGLGFVPDLQVVGDLTDLDDALLEDVVAVVREGVSNVVRHARADTVEVEVHGSGPGVVVVVTDDGVGMGPEDRRSGLANLHQRARARSGTFELQPVAPTGTRLVWSVPLPA